MTFALLLSAVVWLAEGPAEDDWICVASADARGWECGRGENAPELRPLPTPAPPEEQPEIQPLPIRERTEPVPVTPEPTADRRATIFAPATAADRPVAAKPEPPSGPTVADGYTLHIASLTSVEDVESFADNFEVNMARAGRATVMESGHRRYVLTYGWFDTPAAASNAAEDLPPALRALNPRVVSTDSFLEPPVPLRPAVAATDDEPESPTVADETAQEPASAEQPRDPSVDTGGQSAATPTVPTAPPSRESETTEPDAPSPIPSVIVEADTKSRGPSAAAPGEVPTTEEPEAEQPPADEPSTKALAPLTSEVADGGTAEDGRAFAQATGRYTIQLANLPTATDVPEFLDRYGLRGEPVYALSQPDGRSLVVYGRFESLEAANRAMEGLPDSLIAPWIRRAAPLILE